MILIDASSRWSRVCLLFTRNVAFARLLSQMIKLEHNSKVILLRQLHLDNVGEFSSQTFIEYYVLVGINIDHPIAHTHTQNGLA